MRDGLQTYLEAEIIPRYRHFDKAHQEDHARSVIAQALDLSRYYDVDPDLVYTAAAYHDTGLAVDRATHHLESGKGIRAPPHPVQLERPSGPMPVSANGSRRRKSKSSPRRRKTTAPPRKRPPEASTAA